MSKGEPFYPRNPSRAVLPHAPPARSQPFYHNVPDKPVREQPVAPKREKPKAPAAAAPDPDAEAAERERRRAYIERADTLAYLEREQLAAFEASLAGEAKAEAGAAAQAPASTITVDGKSYAIASADGLKLAAAIFRAMSRKDTDVTLESGEVLQISRATIDQITDQLAGAPAKEGA